MATTSELADAICTIVRTSSKPIPISLMNHDANEAAEIIGAVVERCEQTGTPLKDVCMDPDLAIELGLKEGSQLPHGGKPVVRLEAGLGRQIRFERA